MGRRVAEEIWSEPRGRLVVRANERIGTPLHQRKAPQYNQGCAAQASKQVSPRTQEIPIFTLDKKLPEFDQLYHMLSDPQVAYYNELADRMHQAIHIDSDLMNSKSTAHFPEELQREYWDTLERYRGLHVGSVPSLEQGWSDLVSHYSGSKTGPPLYNALRSPGFKSVLDTSGVVFTDPSFARRFPEVHHLLYKAIYGEYATTPWNLMVATRGSSSQVGQHEGIFHTLSAAKMGNIYQTLVPAAERLIRSWAGQAPTFFPTHVPTESVDMSLPVVKAWSSVHLHAPTSPLAPVSAPLMPDPGGYTCGGMTVSGSPCKVRVKSFGERCWRH